MHSQLNQLNATVILRDENDYRTWYNQLQARCTAYNIWDQVNPDATNNPTMEPTQPDLPDISQYTPTSTLGAETVPTRLSDLSSSGQRAYKDDLEIYKLKMERYKLQLSTYKTEATNRQQTVTFIQSTVAPHLQRTCCLPDKTIKEWIKNLQSAVGVTPDFEQKQARHRYQNALKPPRSANTWDLWLAEYDQAATEAERLSVAEISQFKTLSADFQSAVYKIAPIWVTTFQVTGENLKEMTRRKMTSSFRDHMMISYPINRKSQKAAFVVEDSSYLITDQHSSAQGDAQQANQRSNTKNLKRGRPRYQRSEDDESAPSSFSNPYKGRGNSTKVDAYGNSAKADASHGNSTKVDAKYGNPAKAGASNRQNCPACDMRHTIKDCFYINPEIAPEWWQPNPRTAEFVNLKQEHDADFQSLLRAQGRQRTKTPYIKQSQTPNLEYSDQ